MGNNRNIYIYHIPGLKVGVTRNLFSRVTKQQGYKPGEYEILETSTDIEYISDREKFYQKKFGYQSDFNSYKSLNKQNQKGMNINITDATTTFPVPVSDIAGYLTDNLGFKFTTKHRQHILDDRLAEWIENNIRESHFNKNRCYVYNKSLAAFDDERDAEREFKQERPMIPIDWNQLVNVDLTREESRYKAIREWASERGLYEKGDVKTQMVKLTEEQGELARGIIKNDYSLIKDSIGDMIVVLTNLAFLAGMRVEDCIDAAYNEIKDRKGGMVNGSFVKQTL